MLLLTTIMIPLTFRVAVTSSRCLAGARRAGLSTLSTSSTLGLKIRGGDDGGADGVGRVEPQASSCGDVGSSSIASAPAAGEEIKRYVTLADPAPGSPFHYAFPVHSLEAARMFYGDVLACEEGRSSEKWQDYSLHGHQIVCHWVGDDYRCVDYYNPVDGDEVPVPHAGLALTVEQFHALADRLRGAGVKFIIEPHLRFRGAPGEQWTMFFKDPRCVCSRS